MDQANFEVNESTSTLDSGLSDVSPIPYYIWSAWSQEEVVSWVLNQPTLIHFVQTVFNWFGIDGKYLQLLMSRQNELFWDEISLPEEQKLILCEELCRLLGPPMDTPPMTVPTPSPMTPGSVNQKKVRFACTVQSKDYSPRDPAQEFHNSPDLASRSLQQKVYLVKVASKMRVQLQQYHRYGEHYGLSKSDIDNYVLHYSFDGLGSTIKNMVDEAQVVKPPPKPQFNETEKSLIATFKGTWRKVSSSRGASKHSILSWFNSALFKAGLSAWPPQGRRWTFVQYKLGLLDSSAGWVRQFQTSSPYSAADSPLRRTRHVQPPQDISPIYLANF